MNVEQFYFRPTFGPVLAQKLKNKIFPPPQKKNLVTFMQKFIEFFKKLKNQNPHFKATSGSFSSKISKQDFSP